MDATKLGNEMTKMKKTLIISAVIVINLLIGIWIFASTCCFFPKLRYKSQITWLLTKDGAIIGEQCGSYSSYFEFRQNSGFFQINNVNPNEQIWRGNLPIMITNHGVNKTQISRYSPPPPERHEESYGSMDIGMGMMIDPMADNMMDGMSQSDYSSPLIKPEEPYYCLESLDPLTNEVLSRINLKSEYDLNENAILRICIPPHLLMFTNEEPENQSYGRSSRPYEQSAKGDYNKTWTNLVFLENYSNDPMAWEKRTFDDYPPGDAHLLCWEYSPDYQGCFLLFENYPKECNELIYWHVAKQEVTAKVQIQGYREGFQVFSILNDKKHIMVYNENKIEFYSLPNLQLVKTVSHPDLKIEAFIPIAASTDLRSIAYGRWLIYVLDTTSNKYFVLDNRHYNRINMSRFYYWPKGKDVYDENAMNLYYANAMYEMGQLVFLEDKHILTGMTYNDQYYQWDVDARKRIVHKDLAVVPK